MHALTMKSKLKIKKMFQLFLIYENDIKYLLLIFLLSYLL